MKYETLTPEENKILAEFVAAARTAEMEQVKELFRNSNSTYQIASTHSAYVTDWAAMKNRMQKALDSGTFPTDTTAEFNRLMIVELEKVMQDKLYYVQMMFESKFRESIFNYLRADGTVVKWFGIFG